MSDIYKTVAWQSMTDAEIARKLGRTRQAVSAKRKRLMVEGTGFPSPAGHGGARKGAGCKPKSK